MGPAVRRTERAFGPEFACLRVLAMARQLCASGPFGALEQNGAYSGGVLHQVSKQRTLMLAQGLPLGCLCKIVNVILSSGFSRLRHPQLLFNKCSHCHSLPLSHTRILHDTFLSSMQSR